MTRLSLLSLLIAAMSLLSPRVAEAAPFVLNGAGAINVDTNPATEVDLLSGLTGTILDLNIFVEITGGHMEDLQLFLTSPEGTTVQFRADFSDDNLPFEHIDSPLSATFDDEAVALHTAQSAGAIGTFQPFLPLSAFDGESVSGTWTLAILDLFVPDEADQLVRWQITGDLAEASVPEPATMLLLGSGLAALAARRRRRQE